MIKLSELKKDKEYYIVDENGYYDDVIIKFKVIEKLKGGNKKGYVSVKFLKYIYDYGEVDVKYYDDENVIEKLYKDDEERLFAIENIDNAQEYLEKVEEEHEIERRIYEIENHIPEHEYPDWDGDESIMYYLDHYRESEDEDDDEYEVYIDDCSGDCENCTIDCDE